MALREVRGQKAKELDGFMLSQNKAQDRAQYAGSELSELLRAGVSHIGVKLREVR